MITLASFEIFPPRATEAEAPLLAELARLEPLHPAFVSVTYGAGGSDRTRSDRLVRRLRSEGRLPVAAHLTLGGQARSAALAQAAAWAEAGVERLVVLHGDAASAPDGFTDLPEGIAALRRLAPFEISVAAYPEPHLRSRGPAADVAYLARKLQAGASRAITQFFFEAEDFLRLRDRCHAAGIAQPLVPGILPITHFGRVAAFAARCGAHVPTWLAQRFAGLDEEPETRDQVAVATAAELCLRLQREGVGQFHFYTLNRVGPSLAVCRLLGLAPRQKEAA